MIVVVGSPTATLEESGAVRAADLGADVARAAAVAGAAVQLVGRVGDDSAGDAALLDLAAAGVGHVAVQRVAGEATPVRSSPGSAPDEELSAGVAGLRDDEPDEAVEDGLPLDAADLALALRYLPDYRVIVVAADLDPATLATAVEAAGWAGAHLVAIVRGGSSVADFPPDATLLERPADADADTDEAFAGMVARYAVELDRGRAPAEAFAAASSGAGWVAVES